ncbi:MAG: DUF115 domain-containing protein [Treponema sp.]|jgi:hypothetical protein|nr:DUF115 domain-containing protein [Treponema sp.]
MNDIAARLHSRYNPQLEARRYIDALKINTDVSCFILIEPGMGYMIPVLLENRADSKIIVLHADTCFRELPGVFNAEAVWYHDSGINIQEFLEAEVPPGARVRIVEWKPGINVFGDRVLELVRESAEFVKRLEAGRRTDAFFGKRWVRNFFRNIALFQNTLKYKKMDIPVVITGAGPSLEAVLPRIKSVREGVFVLAASSSLQALAAGGITPDMVISTDGGGWALTHLYSFFRLHESDPGILALSFCAAVPSQCSCLPVLPMNDGSLWQNLALNAIGLPSVLIPQRGTVTACALELALEISNSCIFLAGMDLCVRDIRSHARPNGFDHLFFGCASRLRPVYTQYFIRSGGIKSGGSLDVYAAWFKNRLGSLPQRVFSLGPNHEIFNNPARENLFAGGENSRIRAEDYFEPVKQTLVPKDRVRLAADAVIAALGDKRYAPALAAELSPLLFSSRTDLPADAAAREIAGALRKIAKRYYDE